MIRSEPLGLLIQDLRLLRGLELDACADDAGVSHVELDAAERGELTEETFDRVTRYFGVEPQPLRAGSIVPRNGMDGATVFLLHGVTTDVRAADVTLLERALRVARRAFVDARVVVQEAIARRRLFAPVNVAGPRPVQAARQGYRLARRVRGALGLPAEPIDDLCAWMEESLGVVVMAERLSSRDLRACAIRDAEQGPAAVIVAPDEHADAPPPRRARAWLAHELCHILFDPTENQSVRIDLDVRETGGNVGLEESRANAFAAEFLLPFSGVRALVGAARMGTDDLRTAQRLVHEVSEHFAAPWQMTTYHLKNLGVLSPRVTSRLLSTTEAPFTPSARVAHPASPAAPSRRRERFPRPGAGSLRFDAAEADERLAPRHAARAWSAAREHAAPTEGQALAVALDHAVEAWTHARDTDAPMATRVAALDELVHACDEGLPPWLTEELERGDLASEWRDAVILAVEQTQVSDPELRARLVSALVAHAIVLRDEGADGVLWSALRRLASMVQVEEADVLLEFMRPVDDPKTTQAALQAVFSIFSVEVPPDVPSVTRLRVRVRELFDERILSANAETSADAALAFCAYQALEALDEDPRGEVLERFAKLGRRRLTERARAVREHITSHRAQRARE